MALHLTGVMHVLVDLQHNFANGCKKKLMSSIDFQKEGVYQFRSILLMFASRELGQLCNDLSNSFFCLIGFREVTYFFVKI